MSVLGDFREKIRAELQGGLGFEFVGRALDGTSEDRDLGSVSILRGGTNSDNGLEQDLVLGIRVFRQWRAEEPYGPDPAELEEIPDLVNNALKDIQTTPGSGLWFFHIDEFEIDHENWRVDVVVTCRRENPFLP